MADRSEVVLAARDLVKQYRSGETTQRVLDGVSIDVPRGRFMAVMGPSGSGKSTLLHLLGGLDRPDSGEVLLEGSPLSSRTDDERTKLRRNQIGVVYQFFNLVPVLTAAENIALPAVIAGRPERDWKPKLDEILDLVGLTDHRDKQPTQLSGGQQQRAAIGRALFIEPSVLLADEPTGNLDLQTGAEVLNLFVEAQESFGQTIVMVTHDPRIAGYADEVQLLVGGRVATSLDVASKCRGVARIERDHESRARCVLKWLEQQNAPSEPARASVSV